MILHNWKRFGPIVALACVLILVGAVALSATLMAIDSDESNVFTLDTRVSSVDDFGHYK